MIEVRSYHFNKQEEEKLKSLGLFDEIFLEKKLNSIINKLMKNNFNLMILRNNNKISILVTTKGTFSR